ncbi:hypothetical protein [Chamaesiphon minutus]|uniref:hypothetical protein n=1 Tax=Chamaesiphon minutus TaxID=1173032 RepID=UPI0018DEDF08|nr:hypothetical protein [Chamaesiphon minutus]
MPKKENLPLKLKSLPTVNLNPRSDCLPTALAHASNLQRSGKHSLAGFPHHIPILIP